MSKEKIKYNISFTIGKYCGIVFEKQNSGTMESVMSRTISELKKSEVFDDTVRHNGMSSFIYCENNTVIQSIYDAEKKEGKEIERKLTDFRKGN